MLRDYRKLTTIDQPAKRWVFIDENQYGINDGFFVCDPNLTVWVDGPATYHAGAGGVSFAGGHAEVKKWKDGNIRALRSPPRQSGLLCDKSTADLERLQERSTTLQ